MSGTKGSNSDTPPKGPLTVGEAQDHLSALLGISDGDGTDVLDALENDAIKELPGIKEKPKPKAKADVDDDDEDLSVDSVDDDLVDDDTDDDVDDDGTQDEEQDEDQDEDDDEEPTTFRVKVDGKEVKVTLDELQAGYSRTADYTRKTQKLAEERRLLEEAAATTQAQRDEYAAKLAKVAEGLAQMQPKEPDWDKLRIDDPAKFAQARAEWNLYIERRDKVRAEQERVQQDQIRYAQAAHEKIIINEQQLLLEKLPVLKDPKKGKAVRDAMVEYALGLGFSSEDIAITSNHRVFEMLYKAMRYDRLVAKKGTIRQKAKNAPVLRPGQPVKRVTRQRKIAKEARERLSKTGRVEDAAAALFHMDID